MANAKAKAEDRPSGRFFLFPLPAGVSPFHRGHRISDTYLQTIENKKIMKTEKKSGKSEPEREMSHKANRGLVSQNG